MDGGGHIMHPNTKYQPVDSKKFSPRVLKSYFFTGGMNYPHGHKLSARYVYDYELEFYMESEGRMMIEGESLPIRKGDVVLRRPGQYVQGILPYTCYTVCFDLLDNTGKNAFRYDFTPQQFQTNYRNPILDSIPSVTHTEHSNRFEAIFDGILREYMMNREPYNLLLKAYILELIYYLHTENCRKDGRLKADSPYASRIQKVMDYIGQHIGEKILLKDLAKKAGMSPNYLHKIFTGVAGITPNEYILSKKMDKARELLVRTGLPVSEIALLCGFENTPYFSTAFKKRNRMSPGAYRNYYTRFTGSAATFQEK